MDTFLDTWVAPQHAADAGFTYKVIISAAAWNETISWDDADSRETGAGQDEVGRQMDVLNMASAAVRDAQRTGQPGPVSATFTVFRIPRNVRFYGDSDDEELAVMYETMLCHVDLRVIVGGTPTTATISLASE